MGAIRRLVSSATRSRVESASERSPGSAESGPIGVTSAVEGADADEAPARADTTVDGDLRALGGTDGALERHLGLVATGARHGADGLCRADDHHQRFAGRDGLDGGGLLALGADDPVQEIDLHRERLPGRRQRAGRTGKLAREPVALRQ